MALFLQLDIQEEFDIPFQTGSHLLVFMCPTHNDIPDTPVHYGHTVLSEQFWNEDGGHFALILVPPDTSSTICNSDPFIASKQLVFHAEDEEVTFNQSDDFSCGSNDFKIGGVPGWINYAVNDAWCPCGGKMSFVCQIPDGFGFEQTDNAPEQPDSFSSTEYCLFLGNQVYILACEKQCHPNALVAVCDN